MAKKSKIYLVVLLWVNIYIEVTIGQAFTYKRMQGILASEGQKWIITETQYGKSNLNVLVGEKQKEIN